MHALKRAMFTISFTDSDLIEKINRMAHKRLEREAKEYTNSSIKQGKYIQEHKRGSGITRKTLYNILHDESHKVSIKKAELILEAINSERKVKGKQEYSYADIGVKVWGNVG